MTGDIVTRLRSGDLRDAAHAAAEAADEITRLRADLAAARELLDSAREELRFEGSADLLDRIDAALKGDGDE